MTEAVKGAIQFAFDKLSARRIEIRIDATNTNACNLAERLEFILEGTMENDFIAPDGSLRDARVYAKLKTLAFGECLFCSCKYCTANIVFAS